MYKLPAMYVGEYAEQDADLTLKLWQEMKKQMYHEDVEDIFKLETELFPCLVDMRFLGVRVDTQAAFELKATINRRRKRMLIQNKKRNISRCSNMGCTFNRESFSKTKPTIRLNCQNRFSIIY